MNLVADEGVDRPVVERLRQDGHQPSTRLSGSAQTTASSTTISSGTDYHLAVPSDAVAIRLAPGEKRLPVSGYLIEVLSVSANSIEYRITQQGQ